MLSFEGKSPIFSSDAKGDKDMMNNMCAGLNENMKPSIKVGCKSLYCKGALLLTMVAMSGLVFAQSREQRQKANEYKCSFSGKMISQRGTTRTNWQWGAYSDKSKTRGQTFQYTLRLNSKTQEVFTVETYFMASQDRRTFPFSKDVQEIELRHGFTTNMVVCSPMLHSRKINDTYWGGKKEEYGAKVVGVIARLKKDNVIIKTYCSMAPWKKMAWNDDIKVEEIDCQWR